MSWLIQLTMTYYEQIEYPDFDAVWDDHTRRMLDNLVKPYADAIMGKF